MMSAPLQPDPDRTLREAASASAGCLTVEQLDGYLRKSVAAREAESMEEHLRACPHCTNELTMLREFMAAEVAPGQAAGVQWVARSLEQDKDRLLAAAPRPKPRAAAPWWQTAGTMFTLPRLSFASAALVLALSAGLYFRQGRVAENPGEFSETGAYRSGRITGVLPTGDLSAVPEKVAWDAVPSAQKYQVRMLEVDGHELWKTVVTGTTTPLPRAATIHISFTKTLLLEVTAFDQAGKQIAVSEPARFRLMSRRK